MGRGWPHRPRRSRAHQPTPWPPPAEADIFVRKPPAAAVYAFRNSGTFSLGPPPVPLATSVQGNFPASSTRQVTNIKESTLPSNSLQITFDLIDSAGSQTGVTTTTSYEVVTAGPAASAPVSGGIFITKVVSKLTPGGSTIRRPASRYSRLSPRY